MNEASAAGTTSDDYAHAYYEHGHLGLDDYDWSSERWRGFFSGVAERIVGLVGPTRTLDVGCAKGLLVQALLQSGVDAYGYDISETAVATAHPDVRGRLAVRSATEPIEGRYDLISCVEVLEHMAPDDVQRAIDSMCAATDLILFSSNPVDYAETTHVNSNPTAQWAAWFAERGFYRRPDADTVFLTPWAILFERANPTLRTLVQHYEAEMEPMRNEVLTKRQALLETQRRLTVAEARGGRAEVELDDDVLLARHAELTARENVMGLESEVATLRRRLQGNRARTQRLRRQVDALQKELTALRASRSWRWGTKLSRASRLGRR